MKKPIIILILFSLSISLFTPISLADDQVSAKATPNVVAYADISVVDDGAGNLVKGGGKIVAFNINKNYIDEINVNVKLDKYVYNSWQNEDSSSKTGSKRNSIGTLVGNTTYAAQTGWRVVVSGYIVVKGTRIDAKEAVKEWTGLHNSEPIAKTGGPYTAPLDLAVDFNSDGTYDPDPYDSITSYLWDFGDGSTSNEANPTHKYLASGAYAVMLTVTDSKGAIGTNTTTATITEPSGGGTPNFVSPRDDYGFDWWIGSGGLEFQTGVSYQKNGSNYIVEQVFVRYRNSESSTYIREYWAEVRPYTSNNRVVNEWQSADSGWLNAGTFNVETGLDTVSASIKYSSALFPDQINVVGRIMYLPK